jgi:hypothetical protein
MMNDEIRKENKQKKKKELSAPVNFLNPRLSYQKHHI